MRILLVEDEKGVANFVKKGLEEEHYTVDHVMNGRDALSLIGANSYDLMVLDIMLPGMNGIEICRQVRQQAIQTPVMMLTARYDVTDKVNALDSGADDYLTKPFSFDEFLARVRALLRRKKDVITELKYRDLRLDVIAHKVFCEDAELLLSPKEYAILHYLLRNKGRVISRTQILENVWGYDYNPTTNVVDVHIKTLREKLGHCTPPEFIRSVRGVGYTIDAENEGT
jgi:DNA-binding response OmpR family regulator